MIICDRRQNEAHTHDDTGPQNEPDLSHLLLQPDSQWLTFMASTESWTMWQMGQSEKYKRSRHKVVLSVDTRHQYDWPKRMDPSHGRWHSLPVNIPLLRLRCAHGRGLGPCENLFKVASFFFFLRFFLPWYSDKKCENTKQTTINQQSLFYLGHLSKKSLRHNSHFYCCDLIVDQTKFYSISQP